MIAGLAAPRRSTVLTATALAAVLSSCASSPAPTSGAGHFVGFRWRIIEVRHGASDVAIPAALGGFVAFARDRTLRADDSVNAYFGHYLLTGSSYHPLDVGTTLVGWVGHDRARLSLIHAVEALTQSNAAVSANLHGERLQLSTAGYTITCSKLGTAPNEQPPSSPTATPS